MICHTCHYGDNYPHCSLRGKHLTIADRFELWFTNLCEFYRRKE